MGKNSIDSVEGFNRTHALYRRRQPSMLYEQVRANLLWILDLINVIDMFNFELIYRLPAISRNIVLFNLVKNGVGFNLAAEKLY